MKDTNKVKKISMTVCLAVLIFFAGTIAIRFLTRQVLIVGMGMDNAVTRAVFFDNVDMQRQPGFKAMVYGDTDDYSYNWAAKYPFEGSEYSESPVAAVVTTSPIARYVEILDSLKGRIDNYTQNNLLGYTKITELASVYERRIRWNFSSFGEYNGVYQMSDGYWTVLKDCKDCSEHIKSFVSLSEFLKSQDIDLLYVQAPYKVCKYEDSEISGVVDFSNQNADEVLTGLQAAGIDTLDLRESLHKEGLPHHELFFISDHHWKGETGLWAAGKISKYINEHYGFQIDLDQLDSENFTKKIYEDYFLGSLGRKVTLGQAAPEDISLLYPNYPTNLHFEIPSIGIDLTGDFSITYNLEAVSEIDYYNKDPYHAYSYGDRALIQYTSLNNEVPTQKVLLIHDSFSDCMQSFFSLGVPHLDAIDLRYFNGSLETYIKEADPDIVIVMYNAGELSFDVDLSTHTNLFDFR